MLKHYLVKIRKTVRISTVLLSAAILLLISFIILDRPSNIRVDDDLSCEISTRSDLLSKYIFDKNSNDPSLSNITHSLYQHGYYLRNIDKEVYVYISTGDGSTCLLGNFNIDTGKILAKINGDQRVIYLESD